MLRRSCIFWRGFSPSIFAVVFLVLAIWGGLGRLDAALARGGKALSISRTAAAEWWSEAERWAWSQIENGETADFNKRENCGQAPAPDEKNEHDKAWRDPCRTVRADFVKDILTKAPWREATPLEGVNILGARIVGDLHLENVRLLRAIVIAESLIDGAIMLGQARTESLFAVAGSLVTGRFNASSFHSESELFLSGTKFKSDVVLISAKVVDDFEATGASVDGLLSANALQAGSFLVLNANFNEMSLYEMKVTRTVDMRGARFRGGISADLLHVGGDLLMSDAEYAKLIHLAFTSVDGAVDLRGASFNDVNLSGAAIGKDLVIGESSPGRTTIWTSINLRNAHVKNIPDEWRVWQSKERLFLAKQSLVLDGFTFEHIGAFKQQGQGQTQSELRNPDVRWWDKWAKLDPEYSPSPYSQLAAAFKASGDADAADEIQFLGRERARQTICDKGLSFDCWLQSVLGVGVGYGIGAYTFRALFWVLLLSAASAVFLKLWVPEAQREGTSLLWCFGASLSRLLPGVDLSKEFADFFDGPFRPRFNFWLASWFWFIRFAGVVLGASLIAAVAGLTHGP